MYSRRACRCPPMPSAPPDGEPVPPRRLAARVGARRGSATGPSASTCTCRSARPGAATATSTPTPRRELGGGASQASYAATAAAEVRLARRVLGDRRRAGRDRVPRRRHADPAAAARPGPAARRRPRRARRPARRRGHDRGEPRQRRRARRWPRCATPASPGSRSACSRRCRTCSPPWTAPTTRTGSRRSSAGPGRPGFEGVSLDLIYGTPGESQDDWRRSLDAALDDGPGPRERLRAGRRGGHPAGRARSAAARSRRPDDDDLADRYLLADEVLAARRLGWYEVSNWARGERPAGPAQRGLLARRTTGGASGRARTATSAAPAGGTSGTRRRTPVGWRPGRARRRPARCSRPSSAASSACCSAVRLREGLPLAELADAGRAAAAGRSTTACSSRPRTPTAAQR